MRREQQPDQDANKNETDIPPGLGGTNVRFPSKFLNNIYSVRGFFIGDNHFQNGRETIAKKDAFFAQKILISSAVQSCHCKFKVDLGILVTVTAVERGLNHAKCFDTIFGFVSHSILRLLTTW